MKRVLLYAAVVLVIAGCTAGVKITPDPAETDPEPPVTAAEQTVDIDLTGMSASMVYSMVYNMMLEPEEFIGQTVRMTGITAVYHGEEKDYYACIIQDATACCAQGIEFELPEGGYPEEGTQVTVIGTFDSYTEGYYVYSVLRNAEVVN